MRVPASKFPFFAFAAVLALLVACSHTKAPSAKLLSKRKPAPDFALKDVGGRSVKLSDYRGKVVLLNFWATWCGPCEEEIPWFVDFERQFKSDGFEVVGVSMDDDGWKAIKPFVAQHKMNYQVLLGNDSVGQLYGGLDALPTTFIVDRDGKFAFPGHVGLAAKDEYLSEIQTALNVKSDENVSIHTVRPLPSFLSFGTTK